MGKSMTVFRELQSLVPWEVLQEAVTACRGDYKVHQATCRSHFLALMLAMLLHRRSLRDIGQALRGRMRYLSPFGIGSVDRSTLSHANRHRPADVLEPVFAELLRQVQSVAPGHRFRFRSKWYTLDATEIRVSKTRFAWARCSPKESGLKLHFFLDHDGLLPCVVEIGTLRESELAMARRRVYDPGTVLCFDRGYFDSAWFQQLSETGVVFVTRLPVYAKIRVVSDRPVDAASGVLSDQIVRFSGPITQRKCSSKLRVITYHDARTNKTLVFLTNQLTWLPQTICGIYHDRWQIELFFKWIKQNLKLTRFYGCDRNAVQWQVRVALCLYLLFALLKFKHAVGASLHEIHERIAQYLFDPTTLQNILLEKYQFQT